MTTSPYLTHCAALTVKSEASDIRKDVYHVLRAIETEEHFVAKWSASFQGQTPEAVAEALLPHVAAFYGVKTKTQGTGRVVMSGTDKTLRDRAAKQLSRMVRAIVGETSAHSAAVEEAEEKASKAEEAEEATPEQIAAMAELIRAYGLDRKLANKALSKAFALMKAAA